MKKSLFIAAILTTFLAGSNPCFAADKAAKIDELMKLYHKYEQFNGAVLVAENGKIIYKSGIGLANMEWNIPNEPDTKFRLFPLGSDY